jgi:hypothetical protein
MRRAAKVDANQEAIVEALRRAGIQVEILGKPVDLLCNVRGRNELVEVKNRDGKDQLTKEQVEFIARWPGPVHIVHDADEAFRALIPDAMT